MTMKTLSAHAASTLALGLATPALASEGSIQIKGFATTVLPDGAITSVRTGTIGLPAGSRTRASDSVVPTVAARARWRAWT